MTNDEMKRDARKAVEDVQGRIEQGPVQEQISEHSEVFDDMAEYEAADQLIDDSRKAAKNRGWMWIAVAIALLLGAAICVLMIPELTGTKADNAAAVAQTKTTSGIDKASNAAGTGMAVIEVTEVEATEPAAEAAPAATAATSDGNDVSASVIEDEARRVIHGDFGNGMQRRKALGSHYAAVQHRVNELMHA